MRRLVIPLVGVAVAAGVLAWLYASALMAGPDVQGTWKVVLFPPDGTELTLWLVKFDQHKGELSGKVLAGGQPGLEKTKVQTAEADGKIFRLKLQVPDAEEPIEVPLTFYIPEGESKPKVLRGVLLMRGQGQFAELKRSELTTLDPDDAMDEGASGALLKGLRSRDPKQQIQVLSQVVEQRPNEPAAYFAGVGLLGAMIKEDVAPEELKQRADAAVGVAGAFGPEMKRSALAAVARQLNSKEKYAALAVDFGQQAERGLTDADTPLVAVPILKTLATALRKSGDQESAAQLQPRIDKLEETLDREYLKEAVPFKPQPFSGRQNDSHRVVLVELFTGAQCPPCVAADVAFDALVQTFQPKEVVFLQYHLHVPGPDPLTNADSEKRGRFYDLAGTPTYYIDGETGPSSGGSKAAAKQKYAELRKRLTDAMSANTPAKLKLTAGRNGDVIDLAADVSGIEKPGDKLRLRFAIIEDVVRYHGSNGQRLHHHVVRAFPGGVAGRPLDNGNGRHTATLKATELAKSLSDYLTAANARRPFVDDDRPLDLKHLKAVAFVQDDENKKVLQAAQVDLEEAK